MQNQSVGVAGLPQDVSMLRSILGQMYRDVPASLCLSFIPYVCPKCQLSEYERPLLLGSLVYFEYFI